MADLKREGDWDEIVAAYAFERDGGDIEEIEGIERLFGIRL